MIMRLDNKLINDLAKMSEKDLRYFGEVSRDEVYKHIRLTQLIPELMFEVDVRALSLDAGVALSFVRESNQQAIHQYFFLEHLLPISEKLAQALDEADEIGVVFNDTTLALLVQKEENTK